MTDEFRAFRVLLVPAALIVIFFFITPRMCARKAPAATDQTTTQTTAAASVGGLHIDNAPAAPPAATASTYPEGLDAARIQYLVEIDPVFSAPVTATLSKQYDGSSVASALLRIQYIEKAPDGTVTLTRDGLLNLSVTDQGASWIFPIAKRAFDNVTYVSRVEDDKYTASITWHFEPNAAGSAVGIDAKKIHTATAAFVSGGGTWSLQSWSVPPSDQR